MKTPAKRTQEWRDRNPEYHLTRYQKDRDKIKMTRWNQINPQTPLPLDAPSVLRVRQNYRCADCQAPLAQREYIFLSPRYPAPYNAVLVCVRCRHNRNLLSQSDEF